MPREPQEWAVTGRTVCVRLSRQQYETLCRAARQRQSTVSDQIRRAINSEFILVPTHITGGDMQRDSA